MKRNLLIVFALLMGGFLQWCEQKIWEEIHDQYQVEDESFDIQGVWKMEFPENYFDQFDNVTWVSKEEVERAMQVLQDVSFYFSDDGKMYSSLGTYQMDGNMLSISNAVWVQNDTVTFDGNRLIWTYLKNDRLESQRVLEYVGEYKNGIQWFWKTIDTFDLWDWEKTFAEGKTIHNDWYYFSPQGVLYQRVSAGNYEWSLYNISWSDINLTDWEYRKISWNAIVMGDGGILKKEKDL